MDKMNKNELKLVRDILTLPAINGNDAIAMALEFLNYCNKINPSATNPKEKKLGLYSVNVSYYDDKEIRNII